MSHNGGSSWNKPLFSKMSRNRGDVWHRAWISAGIGLESDGINDSLVVHQLITLVVGEGEEIVGFGVSDDLVGFDDLGLARLFLRLLDFVEDVLAHEGHSI